MGDGELFWLTWTEDLGHRRLIAAALLAVAVLGFCRRFTRGQALSIRFIRASVALFSKPVVAGICVVFAFIPVLVKDLVRSDPGQRPDIVLVLLDTVRLDHVGWGGSELDTTPLLDALAAEGVAFTQAIAPASWTKPSTASLLTGVMPNVHLATTRFSSVPGRMRTLAEAFYSEGYRTAAWSSNPNVGEPFGFHQGFEDFRQDTGMDADVVIAEARDWLAEDADQPSFLYLHLNDAHYPYNPHPETEGMFNMTGVEAHLDGTTEHEFRTSFGESMSDLEVESLRLSYAEEIRWLDAQVGAFVQERLAAGRETLVIICSDHGEEFREHGDIGHAHTVYDELLRVPLQVAWSPELGDKVGFEVGIWSEQVRLIDVAPTILATAGFSWPTAAIPLDGRTLTTFLVGENDGHRPALSETDSLGSPISGPTGPLRSYRDGVGNKLIITDPWMVADFANRHWLFDLNADPGERNNLAGEQEELRESLQLLMRQSGWLTERILRTEDSGGLSEGHLQQLAALGYAEDADVSEFLEREPYLDERAIPWWPWVFTESVPESTDD